jgi:dihydroorotase
MSSILIKNALIVNENHTLKGELLIKDELISAIGTPSTLKQLHDTSIIDASGLILIPGVIDEHVHFRDPGLTHKGDIFTESRAAAAGGITSFMDMPNTIPQTISNALLKEKLQIGSEHSLINYSFYLGATNTNLNELLAADPQTVGGIKLFIGSSTGNMLIDNEKTVRELFSKIKLPLLCHCESEPVIKINIEKYRQQYGEDVPVEMHPIIRSREACFLSSMYAVNLAMEYNTRLHILHLSTADEMKLFTNEIPLTQKRITGEVCIHHLWFDDKSYDEKGTFVKWNPAIKTRFDRDALLNATVNDLIDVIATDHAPHTIEEKTGKYFRAPSGGPLVQHSLVAMLELWHRKTISLEKIVEKMCHNPAILFNIEKRGFLREGYKADLCLIDPENPWTVSRDNILYKCGWSPFDGIAFKSKVVKTIVNGTVVYDKGVFKDDYRGQKLLFNR